jgi:mRNA interferase HicA
MCTMLVNPIFKKIFMKKNILEKMLKDFGWYLLRQGSNHEIWTNGEITEPIPRHREINEILAKKIIKKAFQNRVKK